MKVDCLRIKKSLPSKRTVKAFSRNSSASKVVKNFDFFMFDQRTVMEIVNIKLKIIHILKVNGQRIKINKSKWSKD